MKYKLYLFKAINEEQTSAKAQFAQYFGFAKYLQHLHLKQMNRNLHDFAFARNVQMQNQQCPHGLAYACSCPWLARAKSLSFLAAVVNFEERLFMIRLLIML